MIKKISFLFYFVIISTLLSGQIIDIDYRIPQEYIIGGVTVSGIQNEESKDLIIMISNLTPGKKITIPGEDIQNAIKNLYKQGMFERIEISVISRSGSTIYIDIFIEEKSRMSSLVIEGVRKGEANTLKEKINIHSGDILTEFAISNAIDNIKKYYIDKGFNNINVKVSQQADTAAKGRSILYIYVDKGSRVKIENINFVNNNVIADNKLKKAMKDTKEKSVLNIFKSSKYIPANYEKDKANVISKYAELGYKDALILKDSIYKVNDKSIAIDIYLEEGKKYFFRNISWVGNTKYTDDALNQILKIKKGDVYNEKLLQTNLFANPNGADVSALYLDNGYLFFQMNPVITNIIDDSIDIEIQIYEGKQATINKVSVIGNTVTNDRVILREVRSKPGDLFRRSDIMRTQMELSQMRFFNQEKLNVNMNPNPAAGTVDLEYVVEEVSTNQIELSGGWGLGRFVGTFGLVLNNFSLRNLFKKDAWRPIPSGDGQVLSIRGQTNGQYYQSYNLSFIEPWLGGKRPNALSISLFHSLETNGVSKKEDGTYNSAGTLLTRQEISISGASVGLGIKLKKPDDFSQLYLSLNYLHYNLKDYVQTLSFKNGVANNLNFGISFGRNSTDSPIYPKTGSNIYLSVNMTPPYSLFKDDNWAEMPDSVKFKWLEYHKWKIELTNYTTIYGKWVFMARAKFGFMGMYNKSVGLSPFERYYLGGDGLSGFSLDGREIIGMRGYANQVLTPRDIDGNYLGGTIYAKYTMEIRYPLSMNPMASVYLLGFVEAGNTWLNIKTFQPFNTMKSAGVGIRLYMPMFGLLGLDFGIPFDETYANKKYQGQFHFSINASID